jgi:hypothetical protein
VPTEAAYCPRSNWRGGANCGSYAPTIVTIAAMQPASSPLLTDLYQINMMQAYLDHGDTDTAVCACAICRLEELRFLAGNRFPIAIED